MASLGTFWFQVRSKSTEVLTEMVWTDYSADKKTLTKRIKELDCEQLLRYFVSLYTKHIQAVIVRNGLDSAKCTELKAKGICKLLKKECGLSIGTATNLADKMLSGIKQ